LKIKYVQTFLVKKKYGISRLAGDVSSYPNWNLMGGALSGCKTTWL